MGGENTEKNSEFQMGIEPTHDLPYSTRML